MRDFGMVREMQLLSFEVQGFKNLVAPLKIDGLRPINVIHGTNNVGKSNLLQAMQLFFFLVGIQTDMGPPLGGVMSPLDDNTLASHGFPRSEVFNLESPVPILLQADVSIAPQDFERAGQKPSTLLLDRLHVAIELRWMGTHAAYSISRFETADGRDFAKETRGGEEIRDLSMTAALLSKNLRIAAEPDDRFALIGVDRLGNRGVALSDALHDAKDSPDLDVSHRWDRFVETMAEFKDVAGDGTFVAAYDRKAGQTNLFYQVARARIPLRLLGSGVQQLVALFGHMLTCGASIVAVEEPELNLRWTLQERVRDVLRDLVGKDGAPSQIFLTSHSGAFEYGDSFYLMLPGAAGPSVERRPLRDAPLVVGGRVLESSTAASPRAPTRVSGEGTLRLPDRIRKAVCVEHGGDVSFVDRGDGVVEMMSVDTFLTRAGLDDDDA